MKLWTGKVRTCPAAGFQIEHSGQTWTSLGVGPNDRPVWPIEEYLARTNHTPERVEHLKKMNPNGKEEGEAPDGLKDKL